MTDSQSYQQMQNAVQAFHDKFALREHGGEEMLYRIALMAEELGEISECVTKGKPKSKMAEECVDLFILLIGTAISADFDLETAFWSKMDELMTRPVRMVNGRVRVSRFVDCDSEASEDTNGGQAD